MSIANMPPALIAAALDTAIGKTAELWGRRTVRKRERRATETILNLIVDADRLLVIGQDKLLWVALEARKREKAARKLPFPKLTALIEQLHSICSVMAVGEIDDDEEDDS